jgi:spore maturation protein CgeB
VCAPWEDAEGLFTPGQDFLVARDGRMMERLLDEVIHDPALSTSLASHGLATVMRRHTCAHRVDELLTICATLGLPTEEDPDG